MRILVDQDGTVAEWGTEYGRWLDSFGEEAANIPRHRDQTSFNLNAGRTPAERGIIGAIMAAPGFYANLEPIPGAKKALKEMLKEGHDVRIVTSPWVSNPTCASDKLNWVVKHYGAHWGQRVIITTDKTLVRGDVLIDDKPSVTGEMTPHWEHIWYEQPYNAMLSGRLRITNWSEWRDVLTPSLEPWAVAA